MSRLGSSESETRHQLRSSFVWLRVGEMAVEIMTTAATAIYIKGYIYTYTFNPDIGLPMVSPLVPTVHNQCCNCVARASCA